MIERESRTAEIEKRVAEKYSVLTEALFKLAGQCFLVAGFWYLYGKSGDNYLRVSAMVLQGLMFKQISDFFQLKWKFELFGTLGRSGKVVDWFLTLAVCIVCAWLVYRITISLAMIGPI